MKEYREEKKEDTKELIFIELRDKHDYWGNNSLVEMIDFCFRNQLFSERKSLTKLL